MRWYDFVILIMLFVLLFVGVYVLWLYLPQATIDFGDYHANISQEFPLQSTQFYANMRFADRRIGYSISDKCSTKKRNDAEGGFNRLEGITVLDFYPSSAPELVVTCSNLVRKPENEGHFVAGEGGPTRIVNVSRYAVITNASVALYRPESCDQPQIATHEILHTLGFDHNSNQESIMYPITNCEQEIGQEIIDEIARLYSADSEPDLLIKSASASKSGRYLNFTIDIVNYGLRESAGFNLNLIIDGEVEQTFENQALDFGAGIALRYGNIRIPKNTERIVLEIETSQVEIDKNNNIVELSVVNVE